MSMEYAPGMRDEYPDLCWWLLEDGKMCCIRERGHDNGVHEAERSLARFPATVVVHWPSGPVACCVPHATALSGIGQFMGSHIAITDLPLLDIGYVECVNCVNEGPPE